MALRLRNSFNVLLAFPASNPALHNLIQKLTRPVGGLKEILSRMSAARVYDRILDYGCGEGLFCNVFDPGKYVGYDIDDKRVAFAAARYPGYRFTSTLPHSFGDFDIVLFNGVLHHMRPADVASVFDQIARECPTGASLFIIEPLPAHAHDTYLSALILRLECLLNGARPAFVDTWLPCLRGRNFTVAANNLYKHYAVVELVLDSHD